MEITSTLPEGICNVCAARALSTKQFLDTCTESARQWSKFTNYLIDLKPLNGKKGYYIFIDRAAEPKLITDAQPSGDTIEETFKRIKTRISQKTYTDKRVELNRALRNNEAIKLKQSLFAFSCPDCKTIYKSRTMLNRHLKESMKRSCRRCYAVVEFRQFKLHLKTHNMKVISCDICAEVFDRKQHLDNHLQCHIGRHVCKRCKHAFPNLRSLNCHMNSHKTSKCVCGKVFVNKKCYLRHTVWCKGFGNDQEFKCPDCHAIFKGVEDLNAHVLNTAIKFCIRCDNFIPTINFKEHIENHNYSSLHCHECSMKFADVVLYDKHVRSHCNEDYTCVYCKAAFKAESFLTTHQHECHPNKYTCFRCSKVYANERCFDTHSAKCTAKIRVPYICPNCGVKFLTYYYLSLHLSRSETRVCWLCREAVQLTNLKEHLNSHKVKFYSCEDCPECFHSVKKLESHSKKHKAGPFVCNECLYTFKSSTALSVHYTQRHNVQICKCSARFDNSQCYTNHKSTCSEYEEAKPEFICDYCKKSYKDKNLLFHHIINRHTDDGKKYQCDKCGKRFNNKFHMIEHSNTHVKVYKFVCSVCGLKMSTLKGYNQHKLHHSGEKPHPCPHCNARFMTPTQKVRHLYMKHSDQVTFHKCDLCPNKNYSQRRNLDKHMREKHGVEALDD